MFLHKKEVRIFKLCLNFRFQGEVHIFDLGQLTYGLKIVTKKQNVSL